jgi:hypothetical protein
VDSIMTRGTSEALGACLYVGDGTGDLCAALQLGSGDVVLARSGNNFGLLPALTRRLADIPATQQPRVVPWDSGAVTLDTISQFVGEESWEACASGTSTDVLVDKTMSNSEC